MSKIKTAYLMVGVSGSGKSTVVKHIQDKLETTSEVFSLDVSRHSLANKMLGREATYAEAFEYAQNNQKEFDLQVNADWANALTKQCVIVDNTNLTKKSRARWIQDLKSKGFVIIAINVVTSLQTVIDRQKTRGDKEVPEEVVRSMYMRQQEVLQGSEVDFVFVVDGSGKDPSLHSMIHLV